jgi:ATP synthase protein I
MSDSDKTKPKSGEFDDVRQRLDALDEKLDAHRPDPVDEKAAAAKRSDMSIALRVSSDFIAAIFVGGLLGWTLDQFAGTSPFGLIVLLMLGFAAGVLNVMRTLGMVAAPRGMGPTSSSGQHKSPQESGEKGLPSQTGSGIASRRDDTAHNGREDS